MCLTHSDLVQEGMSLHLGLALVDVKDPEVDIAVESVNKLFCNSAFAVMFQDAEVGYRGVSKCSSNRWR